MLRKQLRSSVFRYGTALAVSLGRKCNRSKRGINALDLFDCVTRATGQLVSPELVDAEDSGRLRAGADCLNELIEGGHATDVASMATTVSSVTLKKVAFAAPPPHDGVTSYIRSGDDSSQPLRHAPANVHFP